jgi:SAM-dependent methyltransferase
MAQRVAVRSSSDPTPDYTAIKQRQQKMWSSGDYSAVGVTLQLMSEQLAESVQLHAGWRVLDVACGAGNAALAAARRFAEVVGLDYVPALLERAARRAEAEDLPVTLVEGDAESLPFDDESFDAVLSVVGVMFAPNQPLAADELVRVCRPGGVIGLANWTPDGMIGELLRLVGRYVPPPAGLQPPTRWGTEEGLRELFGDRVSLRVTRREHVFRHRSPEHFVEYFRTTYGPMERTFAAIDSQAADQLRVDFIALVERWNTATDGTMLAPASYLEAVATRS